MQHIFGLLVSGFTIVGLLAFMGGAYDFNLDLIVFGLVSLSFSFFSAALGAMAEGK